MCYIKKNKKKKQILHSREKGFIHFPMCEEILLPLFTRAREEHAAFIRTVKYLLVGWDKQNLYPYCFYLCGHMLPPVRTLKLALTIQNSSRAFFVLLLWETTEDMQNYSMRNTLCALLWYDPVFIIKKKGIAKRFIRDVSRQTTKQPVRLHKIKGLAPITTRTSLNEKAHQVKYTPPRASLCFH